MRIPNYSFLFLAVLLMAASCKDTDDDVLEVDNGLSLKQVNFAYGLVPTDFVGFSEEGLPISGSTTTYTYDGANRLTERTESDGFVFDAPTRYEYENGVLSRWHYWSIGTSDGLFLLRSDITVEGSIVTRDFILNDEINGRYIYYYSDETHERIIRLEKFNQGDLDVPDSVHIYEYDNNTLTTVKRYSVDANTGELVLGRTAVLEYDNKRNPFYKLDDYNPLVFNFLPLGFDVGLDSDFITHVRRNEPHNLTKTTLTYPQNSDLVNEFIYTYSYNSENFPFERLTQQNGEPFGIVTFEYFDWP